MTAHGEHHQLGVDATRLLRRAVTDYAVNDALLTISRVAARQLACGPDRHETVLAGYRLAMVVRALLDEDAGPAVGTRRLGEADLGMLCDLAAAAVTSQDSAFGVEAPPNAWSWAHRKAYQELPDQDQTHVPRSLVLYRDLAPELQGETGFQFEAAFARTHGLTLDEAWTAGYGLYRRCLETEGAPFSAEDLTADPRFGSIDDEKVASLLGMLSCDYTTYRSMLGVPDGRHPHFEPYNLNPFRKFPILRMPSGAYLVPLPSFLLRRVTHGLYYDLIELDRAGYVGVVGRAFNAYVGRVLDGHQATWLGSSEGQPWVVSDASNALIIRSITRPFGALSRATGDREHLTGDLARNGGVVDCVQGLQDMMNDPAEAGHYATAIEGRRAIGLLVALEDFYLANGRLIRGIIDEELRRRGRPAMGAHIQLAHITGLEAICAVSQTADLGLAVAMADKCGDDDLRWLEVEAYARYLSLRMQVEPRELTPRILEHSARRHLDTR